MRTNRTIFTVTTLLLAYEPAGSPAHNEPTVTARDHVSGRNDRADSVPATTGRDAGPACPRTTRAVSVN